MKSPFALRRMPAVLTVLGAALALAGCASAPRQWSRRAPARSPVAYASRPYCVRGHGCYHVLKEANGYRVTGIASWYGRGDAGRPTASGEPYDPHAMRVANKTLPFGTWVRIRNRRNGREAVAMVDDRGPFHRGRVIDATVAVARRLGFYRAGTAPVTVSVIPRQRLSQAQRQAARVDKQRAVVNARAHHGHILAEAGHVAVRGVVDVTATGLEIGVGVVEGAVGVAFHVIGTALDLVW